MKLIKVIRSVTISESSNMVIYLITIFKHLNMQKANQSRSVQAELACESVLIIHMGQIYHKSNSALNERTLAISVSIKNCNKVIIKL